MPEHQPTLAYDEAGSPGALPLIFLHGGLVSRKMWFLQLHTLAASYRVYALDLPGHGSHQDIPFTFETATDLLHSTLRQLDLPPVLLIGISLGGYTALRYARRFPEEVRGLVLASCSDPLTQWYLPAEVWLEEWLVRLGMLRRSTPAFARWLRSAYHPAVAEPIIAGGLSWQGYRQAMHALLRYRPLEDVRKLAQPMLFVNGEFDRSARAGERRYLALAAQAQLVILPGARHACNLDRPEPFNAAVDDFARRLEGM